ncbi:MAG: M48 family metallopeptidase [Armatimonadota bacterium]
MNHHARERTRAYEVGLWLFSRTGLLFIIGLIIVGAGGLTALVALVLRFPSAGPVFLLITYLLYAFWCFAYLFVKPPPFAGYALSESQAPRLYARVRDISSRIGAPAVHAVYISPWVQASAGTTRRFGAWGPTRHYLVLGLPILLFSSEDEGDFLVAHELAHFMQRTIVDKALSTLSYWEYVRDVLRAKKETKHPVRWFAEWYLPKLAARTWARSRLLEFEADRIAAGVTSARAGASLLLRLIVLDRFADEFGDRLWTRACDEPEPPKEAVELLLKELDGLSPEFCKKSVDERLSHERDGQFSHPSVRERLKALGADDLVHSEQLPETAGYLADKPPHSWATEVFGSNLETWVSRCSGTYWAWHHYAWGERYQEVQYSRELKARIELEHPNDPIALSDAVYLEALVCVRAGESEGALAALRRGIEMNPSNPRIGYALGSELAARDEPAAIGYLLEVSRSIYFGTLALRLVLALQERLGEIGAAERTFAALEEAERKEARIKAELSVLHPGHRVRQSHLTPYEQFIWEDWLPSIRRAQSALCVEIESRAFPGHWEKVVLVELAISSLGTVFGEAIEETALSELSVPTLFAALSPRHKRFRRRIEREGIRPFWTRSKP